MKKLFCAMLALALTLCGLAMAETIEPQFVFDPTEGTYPAAFSRDKLKDGQLYDVQLYTVDQYSTESIEKLAVGDELVIEGKTVAISTLEKDEYGDLLINGGFETEGGYTLTHFVPDPEFKDEQYPDCWMSVEYDDFHSYTLRATCILPLDENVTFTDRWDIDMAAFEEGRQPVTASGIEAVTQAIQESENDSFYEHSTEIVIKDGRIVEITRDYVP